MEKTKLLTDAKAAAAQFQGKVFVCADGQLLCSACVAENANWIDAAAKAQAENEAPSDWAVFAVNVDGYEHPQEPYGNERCCNCYKIMKATEQ